MTEIILAILGGLILFLFAVNSLSETIQAAMGDQAKQWILKFTSNDYTAVLTGTLITVLLDSSSAVIIITIVFVNAKLLSFRQAIGIVLGANIGTTISSQIIAMDVGKYSPVLLLIGFVLLLAAQNSKMGKVGKVVLYFGVLFFGLFTMEKAVEPLREDVRFLDWLKLADKPLSGAGIGALVTLVIQSSSATVGMAIILTKKGLLSLAGGIAVMLGAELGTCSDTLLATIKGSRQALRTGLFHLCFNLFTIVVALASFYPFVKMVKYLGQDLAVERSLANAHLLFNLGGVILVFPFIHWIEKGLTRLLPEK